MKIIAGLGNPGREYDKTRHNAGFEAIDEIAKKYNIDLDEKKHKAICGKGFINGEKVILLKPQTYMNLSGESLRAAIDFYKLSAEDVVVLFDDISLEVGQLRIRQKGSAGGHNGIKSIIAHLGTNEFSRIKIGVGEKPEGYDLAAHVLGHFSRDEYESMEKAYKNSADALSIMLEDEKKAMNIYNKKV